MDKTIRFIKIKQVEDITALSKSQVYKLQAEGQFPKCIKRSPKDAVWLEKDVREYVLTTATKYQQDQQRPF